MKNNKKPIARKNEIVMQNLEIETLIYDLKADKAFCLNETSMMVWQLCDGTNSVAEISDKMSRRLKTLVGEDLVWLALDQLNKDGLLENGENFGNHFSGLSRRDVIRKVGFASVIALPIISSIVAPSAAMAQSAAANGQACNPANGGNDCASGNCLNGGGGICCAAGSVQANGPGYIICSTAADVAAFSTRCCSGNASVSPTQGCPAGETRYQCGPY